MVKANQQLLATLGNFLLYIFLIITLSFTSNYNYTLESKSKLSLLSLKPPTKKPLSSAEQNIKNIQNNLALVNKTLKFISSDTPSADTKQIIKILEFLSPLSPLQFCEALDLIIPPNITKIIVLGIMTHRRKCDYDHTVTEYLARSSVGDGRAIAHVVDHAMTKAGGAGASTKARSNSLSLKTPDNFSDLSDRFKAFGADLKTSWHNHLRLVQSSRSMTTKLLPPVRPTSPPIDTAQTACQPITTIDHTRSTDNTTTNPIIRINHSKSPSVAAEIAAQDQHAAYVQDLIRKARYAPPPIRETLFPAQGPFFYGAKLSTTENIKRHKEHIQPIQARALAEQAIKDRIRTKMVFDDYEDPKEDEFSVLLDRFAGVTPKKQTGAKKQPPKSAPIAHWIPPQDYYCTDLYKNKLIRKPNT